MVGGAFHFRGPVELWRFDDDTAYLINSMTLIISVVTEVLCHMTDFSLFGLEECI